MDKPFHEKLISFCKATFWRFVYVNEHLHILHGDFWKQVKRWGPKIGRGTFRHNRRLRRVVRHLGFHALLASFQCQDGRRMKKAYWFFQSSKIHINPKSQHCRQWVLFLPFYLYSFLDYQTFPELVVFFQDFPVLKNDTKFQVFPGFVRTCTNPTCIYTSCFGQLDEPQKQIWFVLS